MTILFDHLVETSGVSQREPQVPPDHITYLLQTYYGVNGTLTRVAAEKDETFYLDTPFSRLVVKLSSSWEDPDVVDLQTSAMRHVARRDPTLPIQRLCPTRAGTAAHLVPLGDGPYPRVMRVLTYATGSPLGDQPAGDAHAVTLGDHLARLGLALADFEHSHADRPLVWDLQHFLELEALTTYVPDGDTRALLKRVFRAFETEVEPRLSWLGRQVCHAGYDPGNVLVDPAAPDYVTGIIDFGTTCRTAAAFDLATGLAGQFEVAPNPWLGAQRFLAGFLTRRRLPDDEVAAAVHAAPARLATRLLLAAYQAAITPDAYPPAGSRVTPDLLRRVLQTDPARVADGVLKEA